MTNDHMALSRPDTQERVLFIASDSPMIPDHYVRAGRAAMPGRTLVLLHGISRNAAELATRFAASSAWDDWTLIAPVFDKARFGQYQQASARADQERADLALSALIEQKFAQAEATPAPVHIFGFSGGAQLAHRYAMLYPSRVAAVYAMAAGWYLMPDPQLPYPFGLGDSWPGEATLAEILQVPMVVAVGSLDKRRDSVVRQDPLINQKQGGNRYTRAGRWQKAMRRAAKQSGLSSVVALQRIAGGTHCFGQCAEETAMLDLVHAAFAGLGAQGEGNLT